MRQKLMDLKFRMPRSRRDGLNSLTESIQKVGVVEPIVVNDAGQILSGKRRAIAAKLAGLSDIPTVVFKGSSDQQRIAEIDANLTVLPLGTKEFDDLLAERADLYARTESKRGFVPATAKRLGVSRRTIEKAVRRSKGVVTEARTRLIPAKQDELAKLSRKDQREILSFAEAHDIPTLKRVVKAAKRVGLNKALKTATLVDPIETLQSLLDQVENLLRDMIAGRVKYEIRNGKFMKTCLGVSMLLKHFADAHKKEVTKPLRRVA